MDIYMSRGNTRVMTNLKLYMVLVGDIDVTYLRRVFTEVCCYLEVKIIDIASQWLVSGSKWVHDDNGACDPRQKVVVWHATIAVADYRDQDVPLKIEGICMS